MSKIERKLRVIRTSTTFWEHFFGLTLLTGQISLSNKIQFCVGNVDSPPTIAFFRRFSLSHYLNRNDWSSAKIR